MIKCMICGKGAKRERSYGYDVNTCVCQKCLDRMAEHCDDGEIEAISIVAATGKKNQ